MTREESIDLPLFLCYYPLVQNHSHSISQIIVDGFIITCSFHENNLCFVLAVRRWKLRRHHRRTSLRPRSRIAMLVRGIAHRLCQTNRSTPRLQCALPNTLRCQYEMHRGTNRGLAAGRFCRSVVFGLLHWTVGIDIAHVSLVCLQSTIRTCQG